MHRQQPRYELALHMDTVVTQCRKADFMSRQRIPKLRNSHRLTSAVSIPNHDISPQYMAVVQELEDLQFTEYSDVVAVVKTIGLRNRPQDDGEGRTPVYLS